jgi:purine-binding chemotaxis protein CheW
MNTSERAVLVVRAGSWTCALPLECVLETMRMLPRQDLAGAPSYVLGASLIRGVAVPVMSLAGLLQRRTGEVFARLVLVRCEQRAVALAVDAVLGIKQLPVTDAMALPPLMSELSRHHVESLSRLDGELVAVLSAARLYPEPIPVGVDL